MAYPIPLGYYEDSGRPRYYTSDGNIALIAPARSGKQFYFLTSICLQYGLTDITRRCGFAGPLGRGASLVIVDPRAEITVITALHRARCGSKVIIMDPFKRVPHLIGQRGMDLFKGLDVIFNAGYNPMDLLNKDTDEYGADADALSSSIISVPDTAREVHWYDSAQEQVSGTAMALKSYYPRKMQNLVALRSRIAGSDEGFASFAAEACDMDADEGLVADRLERFKNVNARNAPELASIFSTSRTQTKFISNKSIANTLIQSDFTFSLLRAEPYTIYLILPLKRLKQCSAWWKLLLLSAFQELLTEPDGTDQLPVLMIIDEMAQMPFMPILPEILACSAGSKLQIMPVVQNIDQLKPYGGHETFIAGCDVSLFTAPRDYTTAKMLSLLMGVKEIIVPTESQREVSPREAQEGLTGTSASYGRDRVPLMEPHEIMQLPKDRFLIFSDGAVTRGFRKRYLDVPELAQVAMPNPYHVRANDNGFQTKKRA